MVIFFNITTNAPNRRSISKFSIREIIVYKNISHTSKMNVIVEETF